MTAKTVTREARTAALLNSTDTWDVRTGETMRDNPNLTFAQARRTAHDAIAAELDTAWRANYDDNGNRRPTHWGDDPAMLAIVGLD